MDYRGDAEGTLSGQGGNAMLTYIAGVTTLKLSVEKCIGCEMCTVVCPHAVFTMVSGAAHISQPDSCMECGACARNCPAGALAVRAGVGCASGQIMRSLGKSGDCCCD